MNFFKKPRHYFDYASATQTSKKALKAFLLAVRSYGNPGSSHNEGRQASSILEDARRLIARMAGVKDSGVIFTSGATEANTLAIMGSLRSAQKSFGNGYSMHILYLPSAHSSVVSCMEEARALGARVEEISMENFEINFDAFKRQLREDTILVSIDGVCGETGAQQDTREVRRILDLHANKFGKKVYLHVDGAQMPVVSSIQLDKISADMLTLDAQKVGGVRGIGALIVARGTFIESVTFGGDQEGGLRSGTPAHALASSFAESLKNAQENREVFASKAKELRKIVKTSLAQIPNTHINEGRNNSPHILNVSFLGRDTDYAQALLDSRGFAIGTKSACETDAIGSRVVLAHTQDAKRSNSTIRISFGAETKKEEVLQLSREIQATISFLDQHAVSLD